MVLRRETGKVLLIVWVCWCAMTLLMFLHLDDRVDIGYHGYRLNAHDDFDGLQMNINQERSKPDTKNEQAMHLHMKPNIVSQDDAEETDDHFIADMKLAAGRDRRGLQQNNGDPLVKKVLQRPAVTGVENDLDLGQDYDIEDVLDTIRSIPNLPAGVYMPMHQDAPGEDGKPVKIDIGNMSAVERAKYDEGKKLHVFNQYVSDLISVHRTLPDARLDSCKQKIYRQDLPTTSVIICFHNEAWSVLLRTVHSVLNRSPQYLTEIILVDDFSSMDHLQEPLEAYMGAIKKVRILRTKQREGLVRARLLGVSVAKAKVLVFLDSHVECLDGWLEPLLDRVATNSSIVVAPIIDMIEAENFNVWTVPTVEYVGSLDLNKLEYSWKAPPNSANGAQPVRTPTIAGGLFAMDKDYFIHMGKYDEGMDIWGSENLEISLRIWMCGGSLEIHPCSHVAHLFRSHSPYKYTGGGASFIIPKNIIRLAEVWLDDYKQFYYLYANNGYKLVEYGDVSERKALRERLQCKTFEWYIHNVFPDIEIPEKAVFYGEIRSVANVRPLCIDSMSPVGHGKVVSAGPCHGQGGNQHWKLSASGLLQAGDNGCLSYDAGLEKVVFISCNSPMIDQDKWKRREDDRLEHQSSGMCAERDVGSSVVNILLKPCSLFYSQRWVWASAREPKPVVAV